MPLAVAPDDSVLFVTNGNSDLRYDSGTVSVVDLDIVDTIAGNWTVSGTIPDNPPGTAARRMHGSAHVRARSLPSRICDETQFMVPNSAARIGNFATDMSIQDTQNGTLRLIIPTRGDPSITWLDWANGALSCNATKSTFELCDDDHRIAFLDNNQDIGVSPEEPFMVWASSAGQFAMVSGFDTGDVTLIDSPIGEKAIASDRRKRCSSPIRTPGSSAPRASVAGRRRTATSSTSARAPRIGSRRTRSVAR